ncbi:hypothetical protein NG895_19550 [Aeoliella sp. ICT_H6.2]|uniref:Uncharacterized protein n=1 Tax=Aeoliella straminimaris TaxID=2954799 RepID=A0A9X2FHI1_9BACT|nr:hypothetical protein [Aeoliella straminimaris]MCO6046101.1 hypothetical protein [Aeoliella straminimaris]
MNTPRRIRTVVVEVPVDNDWLSADRLAAGSTARSSRIKPSNLLPWSDPYIASLVHKLQDEVREEVHAEAEMPWNEPFEYESEEMPGFSIDTDVLLNR